MSVFMYAALQRPASLDQLAISPDIPITSIIAYYKDFFGAMKRAGATNLVCVFDGAADPAKSREHALRSEERELKSKELKALYLTNPERDGSTLNTLLLSSLCSSRQYYYYYDRSSLYHYSRTTSNTTFN